MKLNVTLVNGDVSKVEEANCENLLDVRAVISRKDNWLEATDIDTKEIVMINKSNILSISELVAAKKEKPKSE